MSGLSFDPKFNGLLKSILKGRSRFNHRFNQKGFKSRQLFETGTGTVCGLLGMLQRRTPERVRFITPDRFKSFDSFLYQSCNLDLLYSLAQFGSNLKKTSFLSARCPENLFSKAE